MTIEETSNIFFFRIMRISYNPTIKLTHRHPLNIRLMFATILSGLRLPMESFARTIHPLKIKLMHEKIIRYT